MTKHTKAEVLALLTKMGCCAHLQSTAEIAELINQSGLSSELKQAFLSGDSGSIAKQLDVCPDIVCIVAPAEDDEPSEEDTEEPPNDIRYYG